VVPAKRRKRHAEEWAVRDAKPILLLAGRERVQQILVDAGRQIRIAKRLRQRVCLLERRNRVLLVAVGDEPDADLRERLCRSVRDAVPAEHGQRLVELLAGLVVAAKESIGQRQATQRLGTLDRAVVGRSAIEGLAEQRQALRGIPGVIGGEGAIDAADGHGGRSAGWS
jgi:hypothetical protein